MIDLGTLGIPPSLSTRKKTRTTTKPEKQVAHITIRRKQKSIPSLTKTSEEIYNTYYEYDYVIYHNLEILNDEEKVVFQRDEIFTPLSYQKELSGIEGAFVPIMNDIIFPLLPSNLQYPVVLHIPSNLVNDAIAKVAVFTKSEISVQVATSFTADIRRGLGLGAIEEIEKNQSTSSDMWSDEDIAKLKEDKKNLLEMDLELTLIELPIEHTPEAYRIGALYLLVPIDKEDEVLEILVPTNIEIPQIENNLEQEVEVVRSIFDI